MGVKIAMGSPVQFFEKIVPDMADQVKELEAAGVKITVGFFTVLFEFGGKQFPCSLPVSTTNLMKGMATYSAKMMCVAGITQLVKDVYAAKFPGKVAESVIGMQLNEQIAPPAPKTIKKPMKDKVKLGQSEALLQKVFGTDANSTYYTVALAERVKVAARIRKKALSLRIEGPLTQLEKSRALQAGFQSSPQGHLSLHVDCCSVPPVAVIGGMLFRLGVSFREIVTNEQEIPVENH